MTLLNLQTKIPSAIIAQDEIRLGHLQHIHASYKFEYYDIRQPPIFRFPNKALNAPFESQKGINADKWFSDNCNIPLVIASSQSLVFRDDLTIRSSPRRIIDSFAFNNEWEMLEARVIGLYDVIDAFIILESNYTWFGSNKPLLLLEKLREGYLKRYQNKIIYIYEDHFPEDGSENGWIAETYFRNALSQRGLRLISNLDEDDLFLHLDADELVTKEILLFLKYHDGYPQPTAFSLRWSIFGFFWKHDKPTLVTAGCSVKFLNDVLDRNVHDLRGNRYFQSNDIHTRKAFNQRIQKFVEEGGYFNPWEIGNESVYAGWHCSWCLSPDRIVSKLKSAIYGDFPRWGDYPEKHNESYIKMLIRKGLWFDDKTNLGTFATTATDVQYAPAYMTKNYILYRHLLEIDYWLEIK